MVSCHSLVFTTELCERGRGSDSYGNFTSAALLVTAFVISILCITVPYNKDGLAKNWSDHRAIALRSDPSSGHLDG